DARVRAPRRADARPRQRLHREPRGPRRRSVAADPVLGPGLPRSPEMKINVKTARASLRRLGATGVIGLGVMVACVPFYLSSVRPAGPRAAGAPRRRRGGAVALQHSYGLGPARLGPRALLPGVPRHGPAARRARAPLRPRARRAPRPLARRIPPRAARHRPR